MEMGFSYPFLLFTPDSEHRNLHNLVRLEPSETDSDTTYIYIIALITTSWDRSKTHT